MASREVTTEACSFVAKGRRSNLLNGDVDKDYSLTVPLLKKNSGSLKTHGALASDGSIKYIGTLISNVCSCSWLYNITFRAALPGHAISAYGS